MRRQTYEPATTVLGNFLKLGRSVASAGKNQVQLIHLIVCEVIQMKYVRVI